MLSHDVSGVLCACHYLYFIFGSFVARQHHIPAGQHKIITVYLAAIIILTPTECT